MEKSEKTCAEISALGVFSVVSAVVLGGECMN